LLRSRSRKFGGFFRIVSVVEDAGRNLAEHPRKADERDGGKNAKPVRKAHGLDLVSSGCRSPRTTGLAHCAFRPIRVISGVNDLATVSPELSPNLGDGRDQAAAV
jgi:hypothetical protein